MTINDAGFVAVTDSLPEGTAGAIVLWRLQGDTNYDALKAAFVGQGLDEKLLPSLPSDEVAFRRAVKAQEEKRVLVRKLPTGYGYALVHEQAAVLPEADVGEDYQPLNYVVTLTIKLIQGGLMFSHPDLPVCAEVFAAFNANRARIESNDTANWLCEMVRHVKAVGLRDTGGVYFIPRETLPVWRKIVAALRTASATYVAEIQALKSKDAVDAILDSLEREADTFLGTLEEELKEAAATPDGMGVRAIRTRTAKCEASAAKLDTYEQLLGVKLDKVRARTEALKANLAAAALIAQAQAQEAA